VAVDKTKAQWEDIAISCSLDEFATRNNLNPQALRFDRGPIILPSNRTLSDVPKQHLFSAHSKEILVILQESGLDAQLYQDERERRELVLKSAAIVLPTLFFIGGVVSTVALNVLSNWIYERFVKKHKSEPPLIIAYEDAVLRTDGSVRCRRIEGPADQVRKLLLQESEASARDEQPPTTSNKTRSLLPWDTDQKKRHKNVSRKRKS